MLQRKGKQYFIYIRKSLEQRIGKRFLHRLTS